MIRAAHGGDIPDLCRLGRSFHARSQWRYVASFDDEEFASRLRLWIGHEAFAVLVSKRGFVVVGVMPMLFSSERLAQVLLLYAEDGRGRLLFDAAIDWARGVGAKIAMAGAHGVESERAIARWYQKAGFFVFGHTYMKAL